MELKLLNNFNLRTPYQFFPNTTLFLLGYDPRRLMTPQSEIQLNRPVLWRLRDPMLALYLRRQIGFPMVKLIVGATWIPG